MQVIGQNLRLVYIHRYKSVTVKEKIDRIRRAMKQTGGGPPPSYLTPGELVFWERMCDRPSVQGITGGVDTDATDTYTSEIAIIMHKI